MREVVGKLEAIEKYEPPKEFHWSEVAAVGRLANGSVVVAPTGKQALFKITRPNFTSSQSSQTSSAVLELPGALVAAAFLTRDGNEFVVVGLADRTVCLLHFADEQRGLERCAEWNSGDASPIDLGGLWCARDCILLLAKSRQQTQRQQREASSGGPVLYVLNIERTHEGKQKFVPLRAFTGLPVGTLLHVAAVASDTNRIALIDPSQSAISVFQF